MWMGKVSTIFRNKKWIPNIPTFIWWFIWEFTKDSIMEASRDFFAKQVAIVNILKYLLEHPGIIALVVLIVTSLWVYRDYRKEKKENVLKDEPEISIQIDNCSWGNPKQIGIEFMRLINVALTVNVKNPPVNVTDLQLYIEGGIQKLVDSNPTMPFTQEGAQGCYLARFGFSYSNPNFVISNEVKKYQLRIMANGKWFYSKEFSPEDFSRSLAGDKGGSQT